LAAILAITTFSKMEEIVCLMPVRRIELLEYVVLLGKQIRRLDCETQYAVLIRRFDTSYPTGGYGVSGDQSEQNTI
ncbi:hypothetical protein Tco_0369969, partial [Tanacetum coccineum]